MGFLIELYIIDNAMNAFNDGYLPLDQSYLCNKINITLH